MADTLGKDNPYRYKGYYYDDETGMYYLKSRYYQPEICRFIIARAMGQEFGVKDVAVAAVLGAVGGICGGYRDWRKYIGAAANGIYVGTVAYQLSANLGASCSKRWYSSTFSASGIGELLLPLVDEEDSGRECSCYW
ncbi:MAG: RHS repeat-associated core domain-containing protein [Coprococcus sp.]